MERPATALDFRARLLFWLARLAGRSFRPEMTVAQLRAGYADVNARLGLRRNGDVMTRDLSIPLASGGAIAARLYRPAPAADARLPALLYFHGGGWVIGDITVYDHLTRFFAHEGRMSVIAVGYRLGPEHPFPTAFEDAFDALAFVQRHAAELDIDAARIAVGGDSAGGGIAAVLSTHASERGLATPAFQLLIYPSLDGTGRFPSRRAFTDGLPLTTRTIEWFRKHFVMNPDDARAPFLTPLDAPHPERLPQTYILAAGYDPLVDEGSAYADRLRAAGVPVTYDLRASLPHAFVNMAGAVPAARDALVDAIHATAATLREHVGSA